MFARSFIIAFLLIVVSGTLCGADQCPPEVDAFFSTRKVLLTLPFASGRSRLSDDAKKEIDLVIPCLVAVDENNVIYRVEGFSSKYGEDAENIEVSMERAKAVVNYITQQNGLLNNLFLTGIGERPFLSTKSEAKVEIALYDDLLHVSSSVVEKCSKRVTTVEKCSGSGTISEDVQ